MPDREKVIKGLEYCKEYFNCCDKCPYWDRGTQCMPDLANEVLILLKEQEAVIRQLRLALDIAKGTCKGIKYGGGQFADMPTMQSAT